MDKKKVTPSSAKKKQAAFSAKRVNNTKAKKPAPKKPGIAAFKEKMREEEILAAPKTPLAPKSDVNRRENSSGIVLTAALIVAVLAVNVLIFAIASVTGAYFPLVKDSDITALSGVTDALFDEAQAAGKKVRITFFYSFTVDIDVKNHSTGGFVYKSVQNFKERYPDFIEVDYVNLVTRQSELEGGRISIEKYQNADEKNPLRRYSVAFECGNNIRVVTDTKTNSAYGDFYTLDESLYATSYDGEQFIAGMICNVTRDKPLKAYISAGHSELLDPSFGRLLTIAGYEYDAENGFDLGAQISAEDWAKFIDDCDLLIISEPKSDFESGAVTSEIRRLEEYMRNGGKLMVMLDPLAKKKLTTLESFLEKYGISVSRTTLESDGREVCDIVRDTANANTGTPDGYTFYAQYASGDDLGGLITGTVQKHNTAKVIVSSAGALNLSGNAKPVLKSSESSRCEVDGVVTRDEGNFTVAAVSRNYEEFSGTESTLFVVSGIYSTADEFLTSNGFANRDFYYSVLENAFGVKNLPYGIKMAIASDYATIDGLTMNIAKVYFAIVMAVPASIAIVGTVIVIRRKNR